MPQDQQAIQKSKRDLRHYEQVHRGDAIGMIAQKGLPPLGRRPSPPRHVLGHTRLPDINAELAQFAVDARRAPEWIGKAHVADQLTYLQRHGRPSPTRFRLPAPVRSEPHTMPTDDGVRFDDRQRRSNIGEQPTEADEEIPEHRAAEGPADERCHHGLSHCRAPRSPNKSAKDSGQYLFRDGSARGSIESMGERLRLISISGRQSARISLRLQQPGSNAATTDLQHQIRCPDVSQLRTSFFKYLMSCSVLSSNLSPRPILNRTDPSRPGNPGIFSKHTTISSRG